MYTLDEVQVVFIVVQIVLIVKYLFHLITIETFILREKIKITQVISDKKKTKLKPNENSTYDNCMNLILIVLLAKICKINQFNGELMIKYFIYHINNHLECFNYIISFYRLYITSSPQ